MGKRDIPTVVYFQDNERYADLLNGHIFDGRQVIDAGDISEKDSRVNGMLGKLKDQFSFYKYRDAVRRVVMGTGIVVVGLEHQDEIHYAMPIRVMLEDAASYSEQLQKIQRHHHKQRRLRGAEFLSRFTKEDKIEPVITLVIYYGEKPWDGPKDLYQLMEYEKIPEEMRRFVNNYPMHILEVRNYEKADLFRTDLREVFGFIKRSNDKSQIVSYLEERREQFEHLEEDAFDMITSMSGSNELRELKEQFREEGGTFNMCQGLRDWAASERADGKAEGKAEDILELLSENNVVPEQLRNRIMAERDVNKLKIWLKAAAKISTIEDFEEMIRQ